MRTRAPLVQTWLEPVVIIGVGAAAEGDAPLPDHVAPLFSGNGRPESRLPPLTARAPGARVVLRALERAAAHPQSGELPPPSRRAIVLGSQVAALNETMEFMSEVAATGPALVNPGLFPLTVMNAAAGLAAIRYECTGANLTLNNGATSALDAIAYAADLVVSGSADVVLAGGFESLGHRASSALGRPSGSFALAVLVAVTTGSRAARAGAVPLARLASYGSGLRSQDGPAKGSPTLSAALEAARFEEGSVACAALRLDAPESLLLDLAEALDGIPAGRVDGGVALWAASRFGSTEAALVLAPVERAS